MWDFILSEYNSEAFEFIFSMIYKTTLHIIISPEIIYIISAMLIFSIPEYIVTGVTSPVLSTSTPFVVQIRMFTPELFRPKKSLNNLLKWLV